MDFWISNRIVFQQQFILIRFKARIWRLFDKVITKTFKYCLFDVVVEFHRYVFLSYLERLAKSSMDVWSNLWCSMLTFAITSRSYVIVLSVSSIDEWGFCQEIQVYLYMDKQDIRHKFGKFNFFNKLVILIFLHQ